MVCDGSRVENLKNLLYVILNIDNYIEKSKKGVIEFIGFKFKDLLVSNNLESQKCNEQMKIELSIPVVIESKKKIIKKINNIKWFIFDILSIDVW